MSDLKQVAIDMPTYPAITPAMPSSEDGIIVLDCELTVTSYNQPARSFFGDALKPGNIFPLERIFKGAHLKKAGSALKAALESRQACSGIILQITSATGCTSPCTLSVHPLQTGPDDIIGVMLTLQGIKPPDCSESSRQNDALPFPGSGLGHRNLLEALPEGVFTINTRWRIVSFNRTAEKITGYRRSEVMGRYCWEIFRSDLCKVGCPLRTALETGQSSMDQDVRIIKKGGSRQTILVNAGVLHDHMGHVTGAVETFRPLAGEFSLLKGVENDFSFDSIIGKSPFMQSLFTMLPDVAASDANVLICGESGTGKDLLARTIHNHSARSQKPFLAVNCSALAESLLESELFGHEKSAFTGAVDSKPGRFELAKGGTLFLDEIGELKPALQVKLLRVLEQREFERVGGTRTIPLDARIISATNRNLQEALQNGTFREDFYYRLRTVPLSIPPLRERSEDIPLLVDFFIRRLNSRYKKRVRSVDSKIMRFFMQYHWPGNVRELERTLEHAYVFVKGSVILPKYLPSAQEFDRVANLPNGCMRSQATGQGKQTIEWALSRTGGRRKETAELLGMSRTSLWRRMKELGLV